MIQCRTGQPVIEKVHEYAFAHHGQLFRGRFAFEACIEFPIKRSVFSGVRNQIVKPLFLKFENFLQALMHNSEKTFCQDTFSIIKNPIFHRFSLKSLYDKSTCGIYTAICGFSGIQEFYLNKWSFICKLIDND